VCGRDVGFRGVRSGGMLDAHGMVRDVFMEIRQDQQELKHTIALFGLGLVGAFFQIFHRGERVGKQPFQTGFAQRGTFTAARESLIGTHKSFVEKMIEAKLRAGQRRRRRLGAPRTDTMDGDNGFHPTPLILERLLPRC
jgi:hypothetical protein